MKNQNYKQTEIGEIPTTWNIGKLKDYVLIKGRIGWKGLKKSEYVLDGYAIINGQQLLHDRIIWEEVGRITKERYLELSSLPRLDVCQNHQSPTPRPGPGLQKLHFGNY